MNVDATVRKHRRIVLRELGTVCRISQGIIIGQAALAIIMWQTLPLISCAAVIQTLAVSMARLKLCKLSRDTNRQK